MSIDVTQSRKGRSGCGRPATTRTSPAPSSRPRKRWSTRSTSPAVRGCSTSPQEPGTWAIAAARRGARVTGLDIAPKLLEVARPGATIAITAWTPEGLNGTMFRTIGSYMPTPPPELKPPVSWGDEQHVSSLFANTGAELSFERRTVTFTHDSPESWVEYNERVLGPTIMAKAALEPVWSRLSIRSQGLWVHSRSLYSDGYTPPVMRL
jgi:hypothetical protein